MQFEAARRIRTDAHFREVTKLEQEARTERVARYTRLRGSVRADMPIEAVAKFLSLLANGLAFARTTGDELPDLDLLNELVETGVGPR